MRSLLTILIFLAAPAAAQATPAAGSSASGIPALPPPSYAVWNPASDYITAGQDEPGYRSWYLAAPWRATQVNAFNDYLATYQVSGILPTWQLLRTATSWHKCGGQPFEVPPTSEWPHIVQTLRYVRDYVVPAVGPVEAVSAYRNPSLNACAGGAPESAHKHYSAIDMVPLRPTTREQLMRTLCAVQARRGPDYQVGLGFYAFLRFHVDTTKYRRWGTDAASNCPPIIRPTDLASVAQPLQPQPADPASAIGAKAVYAPPVSDTVTTAAPPVQPQAQPATAGPAQSQMQPQPQVQSQPQPQQP
jgi:hypothetical protein